MSAPRPLLPTDTHGAPDPVQVLHAARPTTTELHRAWTGAGYAAGLARVLAADRHGRIRVLDRPGSGGRPGRRIVYRVAAAGVLAAALVGAGALLAPRQALPQASALQLLAATAADAPAPSVGPGQFRHLLVTADQMPGPAAVGAAERIPAERRVSETWLGADGSRWDRIAVQGFPARLYRTCPADQHDPARFGGAAYLAALPTDADHLLATLRSDLRERIGPTAAGKPSLDDEVFQALAEFLRPGQAGPAVRAAGITAMSRLPGVSASESSVEGRQVVDVRQVIGDRTQVMRFDRASATLLTSRSDDPAVSTSESYAAEDVVSALPADVAAAGWTFCGGQLVDRPAEPRGSVPSGGLG